MTCSSDQEHLLRLFYTASSSSFLLLIILYFSSTFLLNLLNFIGGYPIIQRNQNRYEYNNLFSDEEEEEEQEEEEEEEEEEEDDKESGKYYYFDGMENDHHHHMTKPIHDQAESLEFPHNNNKNIHRNQNDGEEFVDISEAVLEDQDADDDSLVSADNGELSVLASAGSESEHDDADTVEEEMPTSDDADIVHHSVPNQGSPTSPTTVSLHRNGDYIYQEMENKKVESKNFISDEKFFIYAPTELEAKKLRVEEKDDEEIFGDSCTVGSTSKSSSEWRSSIKDSGTEDPFSSSSRRSCPKWESYTVFQKYDEEMMFLDRISAKKLNETESLKSIQVCPRSISDRIVHKFTTMNKKPSDIRQNPYHELEATYVAQICLAWEALNCNYKNFQRKRATQREFDPGCPAHIAQRFQQFQVLLQRYVENESYEQGRRPEVYARMRLLAPKLLLVPEYRDSEDDEKDDGFGSTISSTAFLMIMEDGIQTFMNFLRADKEKPGQILKSFFRRNKRGSVDPALLHSMKKVNKKKKMKLNDLRRSRICLKKKQLTAEDEMEIFMGLTDLKVVSRVLRMSDISEEQLHWCEEKMSKVRILDGKLQRDSLPFFFPAH